MILSVFRLCIPVVLLLTSIISQAQDSINVRPPTVISISEAVEKQCIELKIRGAAEPGIYYEVINSDGVYFGKCMAIFLKSKIDSVIHLRLDAGTQLIPEDSSVQTMIVTQKAIFPLPPRTTYATRFYAMCGQIHDASPDFQTTFRVGELAKPSVVKLAKYLGENYIQNMIGQHAMWIVTDGAVFEELRNYGADSWSMAKSNEILENLNLITPLTPKPILVTKKVRKEIRIHPYYVYGGAALLAFLATTTLILLFKRRKKHDTMA